MVQTCVEISLGFFGGVTLGNFPVKMTSIYFKIDSTYLAALWRIK